MAKPPTKRDRIVADRNALVDELVESEKTSAGIRAKIEAIDWVLELFPTTRAKRVAAEPANG